MSEREEIFEDKLMTHGWPENGPGRIDVETLYQAFKARLMRELAAQPNVKDLTESQQQALERFFDSCSRSNAGG
jgi:hypothetical protein